MLIQYVDMYRYTLHTYICHVCITKCVYESPNPRRLQQGGPDLFPEPQSSFHACTWITWHGTSYIHIYIYIYIYIYI